MITPKVHITLPEHFDEDEYDEARHFAPILPLLKGVIEVNVWHIRRALRRAQKGLGYPIPPLYASGVRYKEDPPGQENWKDCLAVLADGHGDCDRLVAWRVAELLVAGCPAEPIIKWKQIPKDVMVGLGHPPHMVPPGRDPHGARLRGPPRLAAVLAPLRAEPPGRGSIQRTWNGWRVHKWRMMLGNHG